MKKISCFLVIIFANISFVLCQESSTDSKWEFNTDVNFYFIPDNFFLLPVIRADKNKLHLETRYNYEDLETFSFWAGYNFSGGKELEYNITPMIGGVTGLSDGVAPGLELTLGFKGFELYSESEYLFESNIKENNFYYNWSDLTYSPNEKLWFGISGQRTRLYQTDLDIQRGLIIGGSFKRLEVTGYIYNLFFDDPFVLVTLSAGF